MGRVKTALVRRDQVSKDTEITHSLKEFIDKLEPGDIIATKGSLKSKATFGVFTSPVQKLRGASKGAFPWGHVGVYIGDGKIRHAYTGIKGKSEWGEQKVRDHKLKSFTNLGRDMLALRPKLSDDDRKKAVELTKDLSGKDFDYVSLVRAGFLPKDKEKGELEKGNLPDKVICTSLIGYSYPKMKFKDKSIHTLMPAEVIDHKKVKSLVAFSADKPFRSVADFAKEIGAKLKEKTSAPPENELVVRALAYARVIGLR